MPDGGGAPVPPRRVRLWDGPVRIVHWLLVGLIGFCWWSADDHLQWHAWSAYAIIALVLFRIYWGFAGSGAARFASFVKGPLATFRYLGTLSSRAPSLTAGHNPLGALSILAILACLIVQLVTGLFTGDIDGLDSGPLSDRVSFDTSEAMGRWHDQSFTALQVLVALHVAAVVFYLVWKRTNLIAPMITGMRTLPADPGYGRAPWWRLIVGAAACAAIAWFVSKGLRV